MIEISRAKLSDLNDILNLLKESYLQEAEIYNDFNILPMTQNIDSITAEWLTGILIKTKRNRQIIGSIRAELIDNVCKIGKLIVKPDFQNHGIGKKMMAEIERIFYTCTAY